MIRDSAPHINTVIIIGCIVMLVGCYLLGIDSDNPPDRVDSNDDMAEVMAARDSRYKIICTVRQIWCSLPVRMYVSNVCNIKLCNSLVYGL